MKPKIRVLISADDSTDYLRFLPVVSVAWSKILGVKPTLAYVSDAPAKQWMNKYCEDIIQFPVDRSLPNMKCRTFAARMVVRYRFENDVCMVSDLDMLPLNADCFRSLLQKFTSDKFLSFGYNAFENGDGDPESPAYPTELRKFPSCYTVATGRVWKEIINPQSRPDTDLIKSWYDVHYYDHKESVNKANFCDESLMRALIQKWDSERSRVIGINREKIKNTMQFQDRLDRSSWFIDSQRLHAGSYIDAHCPKPITDHFNSMKILTNFLHIPLIIEDL